MQCGERPGGKPQLSKKLVQSLGPSPSYSPGLLPKGVGRRGGIWRSEGQEEEEEGEGARRRWNKDEKTGQMGRGRGRQQPGDRGALRACSIFAAAAMGALECRPAPDGGTGGAAVLPGSQEA